MKTVKCPTCMKVIVWERHSPYRPFCSERCKLIDLGDWASEAHRIPDREPVDDDMSLISKEDLN